MLGVHTHADDNQRSSGRAPGLFGSLGATTDSFYYQFAKEPSVAIAKLVHYAALFNEYHASRLLEAGGDEEAMSRLKAWPLAQPGTFNVQRELPAPGCAIPLHRLALPRGPVQVKGHGGDRILIY
jgi:hypothetical protein